MESKNYRLNEAKMFADITDGIAIIINASTGIYYGMNGYGTGIFDNLLAGSSTNDILTAIKALPDVPANAEEHLSAFLETLLGFEIIIPAPESSREASLVLKDAVFDQFIPVCKEYKDVQELLYADPIHEVSEEEGWKPEK
ncbi:MAG: PqqD family protein [Bacteroidales bacterium]|nr:PqqD family protein [Bacteroidales bacterium]